MENRKKVSIVIPVRNNLIFTKQCLNSIAKNTDYENFEVIIVDNASTDETADFLANFNLPIKGKVITNGDNKTYSVVNNQARTLALDSDFILTLNNDTIVTKGWLSKMLEVFNLYDNIGAVGCKLLFPGSGGIQHAGVYFMHHGIPDHSFIDYDKDDTLVNQRSIVPAVTAACMLMPTNIFDEAGGFDERYHFGYEDIALCNKIRELGYKVIYEPKAIVYHYGSMTPGRYNYENTNFNIYARDWIFTNKYLNVKTQLI
jgi:GT2 family glycosyltransferase